MSDRSEAIRFRDALHLKSAEFWLRLGQPAQAWEELQRLSPDARKHPWTNRVLEQVLLDYRAAA